mmetsp:Transcript_61408/g.129552  ORF Transcript_61408/g.129552 Transcript_61408/m.129552 type:complete len:792 (+) Transcript_61408:1-2376(+)
MQDARLPHFLMKQVGSAMNEHSVKSGNQYKKASYMNAEMGAMQELTEESVPSALVPLLSDESPLLKIHLSTEDEVEDTTSSTTTTTQDPFEATWITTSLRCGDSEQDFGWPIEEAKSQPQQYLEYLKAQATKLAGCSEYTLRYEDEDGDSCTLMEATCRDALAQAKATTDPEKLHLTVNLHLASYTKDAQDMLQQAGTDRQKGGEDWQSDFEGLKIAFSSLKIEAEDMREAYLRKCADCSEYQQTAQAYHGEVLTTKERLASTEMEADALRSEVANLKYNMEIEMSANARLEKRIRGFRQEVIDLEQVIDLGETRICTLQDAMARLQKECQEEREKTQTAQRELLEKKEELADLKNATSKRDATLSALVLSSQPDIVGLDCNGPAAASNGTDITATHKSVADAAGAKQIFQVGHLQTPISSPDLPVIYTVRFQNDGGRAWPCTTALVHESGPLMDLPLLPLTDLGAGDSCDAFFELTVPKVDTPQTVTSTWVLRDVRTGQPLGPILTMAVEYVAVEEEQEEQEEEEQEKEPANDAREDEVSVSLLEVEEAPAEDSNDKLDSVQAADVTEELQSFEEQADTNKDGKLSLDEVKVFFKSHVGSDLARKFHISMVDLTAEFEAADSNKDGFLEHQELMDLDLEPESGDDTKEGDDKDTQQKDGDSQASLVEVSKSAPTNKDKGHHKTKKAKAALSDFAASTSELKDTFDHIDTDKDGRISWLDFKAGLRLARTEKKIPADMDIATVKSDFKQADGDKDGYIGFKDFVDLAKAEFRRWGDSAGDMLGSLLSLKAA